jgi:hypothetical protein
MLLKNPLDEGDALHMLRKTRALYQGTTLQAAEKLLFLKGTAFRPYANA